MTENRPLSSPLTESGKLKGKKIGIGVASYNDNDIYAYSPEVKKKVKVN